MNIAFYITNHGFGHIMRNIPVMAHILKSSKHRIILVSAEKQIDIAKEYMEKYTGISKEELENRFICVKHNVDLGLIVKPGTLLVDEESLKNEVTKYIGKFPSLIQGAKELFIKYNVDKVVCDIVPWALTAAKVVGIPSILMASFTWIEIYEEHLPEYLTEPFRSAFSNVDRVILYELANKPTLERFPDGIKVGFSARPFHMDKVQEIRIKYGSKPIVFLSIGGSNDGINKEIDVSNLTYTFITTSGLSLKGDNVHHLPVETDNTQDYIAASDYCISKAGWGTIAEMLLAGKPMALVERPDVAEDRMSIETLVERNEAISIKVDDLCDIETILDSMKEKQWTHRDYCNDYKKIADIILECDSKGELI